MFDPSSSYLYCVYCKGVFQKENEEDTNNLFTNHRNSCTQENPFTDDRGFYDVIEIPIVLPTSEPNWQGFNVALLQSVAYNRIAKQSTNIAQLQALQIMLATYGYNPNVTPDLPLIKNIWQVVVWGLETPPTLIEIESINELCDRYSIGFQLDSSGFVEIN